MTPQELKQQLCEQREGMAQNHATRLHRALSWLLCAQKYEQDDDLAFITLWISFNACYSVDEHSESLGDRATFRDFIERLCKQDSEGKIYDLLWMNYSGFVRSVINNQFLFAPFWVSHHVGNDHWQSAFEQSQRKAMQALANRQVSHLLRLVLDRLYVMRNQMVHGGATYNSKVNREQVKSSRRLLAELLPVIVQIMLHDHEADWGKIRYPVVNVTS